MHNALMEVSRVKVLLVNGGPHQKGCTYTALSEVAASLNEESIETEFYWIDNKPIGGCIGCFQCANKQKCVFDDTVNQPADGAQEEAGAVHRNRQSPAGTVHRV